VKAKEFSVLPPATLRFIEPMYATLVRELPEGDEWQYEIKLDGYRCLAGRSQRAVALWSRRQNGFGKQFPNIARACQKLAPDTLVDGEVVALDENGRVSFNLLQNHRSHASAIHPLSHLPRAA
jgi:bifunctional non-homologous end joining protein LigD